MGKDCRFCGVDLRLDNAREVVTDDVYEHMESGDCIAILQSRAENLRAENARLRIGIEAIAGDLSDAVRHFDNNGTGMQVPYHGPFAAAKQLPSVVNDVRRLHRTARVALDGKEGT